MSGHEGWRSGGQDSGGWQQQPPQPQPPQPQPPHQQPPYHQQPAYQQPPTYPYEPPTPPGQGRSPGAVFAIVASVLVVLAVVAATIVVATDSDEDGGSETAGSSTTATEATETTGGPVTTAGPDVPEGVDDPDPGDALVVEVPGDYVRAEDQAMPVALSMPPTWVWSPVSGDGSGVGDRLAPDEPTVAARIDENMEMTPRGMVFVAMPGEIINTSTVFFDNVNVLEVPAPLPSGESAREELILSEVESFADEIYEASYVEGEAGAVLRVRYDADLGVPLQFIQYWAFTDAGDYSLTVTARDVDQYGEAADVMAASLGAT